MFVVRSLLLEVSCLLLEVSCLLSVVSWSCRQWSVGLVVSDVWDSSMNTPCMCLVRGWMCSRCAHNRVIWRSHLKIGTSCDLVTILLRNKMEEEDVLEYLFCVYSNLFPCICTYFLLFLLKMRIFSSKLLFWSNGVEIIDSN